MAVTLRDIAKKLDISHVTVSLVLNDRRDVTISDETRARVIDMAQKMGYRPNHAARALAKGRTQMIALWMASPSKLYYGKVFETLYGLIRNAGYETVFCLADYADSSRKPYDWPVDGIVAVDTYELVGKFELPKGIPVVTLGSHAESRSDSVTVDIYGGATKATQHLVEIGCKRIAHVTTQRPLAERTGRSAAYKAIVKGAGLKSEVILCEPGGPLKVRESICAYVEKHGLPDGMFCYSDDFAFATMRAIADLGYRVGKDCAVIGFDNVFEAQISIPTLSSVAQPLEDMCRVGMHFLLNRIREPHLERQVSNIQMSLVTRDSTIRE
ncbi:MAG: LacI family DNA-binding transcriptional regulator [Fimbriimonas sp.]|nr:LacI family DNA-binding transcriptional regulator [Fimbriimonas sp.]